MPAPGSSSPFGLSIKSKLARSWDSLTGKKSSETSDNILAMTKKQAGVIDSELLQATVVLVSQDEDGGKEAIRALKSRLKSDSPDAVASAIFLLNEFYSHCGVRFQVEATKAEVLESLTKYISSSMDATSATLLVSTIRGWLTITTDPTLVRPISEFLRQFDSADSQQFPPVLSTAFLPARGSTPSLAQARSQGSLASTEPPADNLSASQRNLWDIGRGTAQPHAQVLLAQAPVGYRPPPQSENPPPHVQENVDSILESLEVADNSIAVLMEALGFSADSGDIMTDPLIREFRGKCMKISSRVATLLDSQPNPVIQSRVAQTASSLSQVFSLYDDVLDRQQMYRTLQASEREHRSNLRKEQFDTIALERVAILSHQSNVVSGVAGGATSLANGHGGSSSGPSGERATKSAINTVHAGSTTSTLIPMNQSPRITDPQARSTLPEMGEESGRIEPQHGRQPSDGLLSSSHLPLPASSGALFPTELGRADGSSESLTEADRLRAQENKRGKQKALPTPEPLAWAHVEAELLQIEQSQS